MPNMFIQWSTNQNDSSIIFQTFTRGFTIENMLSLESQVFLPFIPITNVRVLLLTCLIARCLLVFP